MKTQESGIHGICIPTFLDNWDLRHTERQGISSKPRLETLDLTFTLVIDYLFTNALTTYESVWMESAEKFSRWGSSLSNVCWLTSVFANLSTTIPSWDLRGIDALWNIQSTSPTRLLHVHLYSKKAPHSDIQIQNQNNLIGFPKLWQPHNGNV